jgi:hypothetical protein
MFVEFVRAGKEHPEFASLMRKCLALSSLSSSLLYGLLASVPFFREEERQRS